MIKDYLSPLVPYFLADPTKDSTNSFKDWMPLFKSVFPCCIRDSSQVGQGLDQLKAMSPSSLRQNS